LDAARSLKRQMWSDWGVGAAARPLSDCEPSVLETMINKGSPGEYRRLGITDRRDPRLVAVMSMSLARYGTAGRLVHAGKREPKWVSDTIQPTLSFGKEEPKAAKREDGRIVPPVPRFIFNLSPINYALAAFLHSDLSHSLQSSDPTHGPGFGPGRGRSGKFLDVVNVCFDGKFEVPEGEEMVMSDIAKWDASMPEALIYPTFDNIESAVTTSHMDSLARVTRNLMTRTARRQLGEKLLEHPSGYLLHLFGTMPSGSYYTSCVNTEGNNLLVLAHIIDRAVHETSFTAAGAAEVLRHSIRGRLVSYGDNQLFSAYLFKILGMAYDPDKHAEFLGRFGMKLKVDETEVTRSIARVRFCSRSVVQTPEGPIITRTHSSIASKLSARPEHDPVVDKLYVRAIMADHMGTDPIVYEMLSSIDRQIDVSLDVSTISPRVRPILAASAKSLYGSDADEFMLLVLRGLSASHVDRRALLTLHTPRGGDLRAPNLGDSLTLGDSLFGGPLIPPARFCSEMSASQWINYLRRTGQTGVLTD